VSGAASLEGAVAEHREAVAGCAATIRAVSPELWSRSPTADKWSPAEIAEHLAIAYEPALAELDGGSGMRILLPWWQRQALRWLVLPGILRGGFPRRAPAPRELRPRGEAAGPDEAARRLSDRAEAFLNRLARAEASGPATITHAYFGRLSGLQAVKVLTSHANHHRKQFPGAAPARSGRWR
jgi:hypothetical protein